MVTKRPEWRLAQILWATGIAESKDLAILLCLSDGKLRLRSEITCKLNASPSQIYSRVSARLDKNGARFIEQVDRNKYKLKPAGIAKMRLFINRLKDIKDASATR